MGERELERLLSQRHKDVTMFEYEGRTVPCIILDEARFDEIIRTVGGRPVSVETNLNILQDGLGHVFVRITMAFSQVQMEETVLLYANEHYDFFEALKETSLMALSSPHSSYGSTNVFMIQMPKRERTENALETIKKGLGR
ncbi:MAG: hypothetical protein KGI33_03400 [Thaumarchaeota archaeon]|nr:hypothetical protein [Nitrososphaerota archaeon]